MSAVVGGKTIGSVVIIEVCVWFDRRDDMVDQVGRLMMDGRLLNGSTIYVDKIRE